MPGWTAHPSGTLSSLARCRASFLKWHQSPSRPTSCLFGLCHNIPNTSPPRKCLSASLLSQHKSGHAPTWPPELGWSSLPLHPLSQRAPPPPHSLIREIVLEADGESASLSRRRAPARQGWCLILVSFPVYCSPPKMLNKC